LSGVSAGKGLVARKRSVTPRNRIFSQQFIDHLELVVSGSEVLGLMEDIIGHQLNED
jgi:hypothetical protein